MDMRTIGTDEIDRDMKSGLDTINSGMNDTGEIVSPV